MEETQKNVEDNKYSCNQDCKPREKGKMTEGEKYLCSQNYRDVNQEKIYMAERRACELADEFTRLEVQIAVILFGVMGLISNTFFNQSITAPGLSLKIGFAAIFFLLTCSLAFGLIHIKIREFFWSAHMKIRISRALKWDSAIRRKTDYDEAMAFHEGTSFGKMDLVSSSPDWTWILQTICLGLAFIILFGLILAFLF